jgi:DDE family transposase
VYRKRSVWVEPLFAEGKQWHGMRRFRLRRLWRVNSEALLIASGQNLKRLLQKRGWGRRPFATEAMSASFYFFYVFCSSLFRGISHKRVFGVVYENSFSKVELVLSPTCSAFPIF